MNIPAVEFRGVRKHFGDNLVLDDIDLTVHDGECVAIIGPSGSGKSTLLRCVNQLEAIDRGAIALHGDVIGFRPARGRMRPVSPRDQRRQRSTTGMVFQQFNLFPHLTAAENIAEGLRGVQRMPRRTALVRAAELLERVGLAGRSNAYPRQLSGGQQQRVAIARALALEPRIMLFDEPTSALDPELVEEVLQVVRQLATTGMTLLIVTHEMGFAADVADRVIVMDAGRIVESGAARQVMTAPAHERTQAFLSRVL